MISETITTIARIGVLWLFLLPASVEDGKSRRISNVWCAGLLFGGGALAVLEGHGPEGALGALSGLLLGLACRVAVKGGFGLGDVKLLCGLGAALQLPLFLEAMAASGVVTLLAAAFLLATRRKSKTDTLPLAPFLLPGALAATLELLRQQNWF